MLVRVIKNIYNTLILEIDIHQLLKSNLDI